MRIITRRKVKVRVTVRRGDGSVVANGWAYEDNNRKQEDETDEGKRELLSDDGKCEPDHEIAGGTIVDFETPDFEPPEEEHTLEQIDVDDVKVPDIFVVPSEASDPMLFEYENSDQDQYDSLKKPGGSSGYGSFYADLDEDSCTEGVKRKASKVRFTDDVGSYIYEDIDQKIFVDDSLDDNEDLDVGKGAVPKRRRSDDKVFHMGEGLPLKVGLTPFTDDTTKAEESEEMLEDNSLQEKTNMDFQVDSELETSDKDCYETENVDDKMKEETRKEKDEVPENKENKEELDKNYSNVDEATGSEVLNIPLKNNKQCINDENEKSDKQETETITINNIEHHLVSMEGDTQSNDSPAYESSERLNVTDNNKLDGKVYERESRTSVYDYDNGPIKIEIIATSRDEGHELNKRGKVEMKFTPFRTRSCENIDRIKIEHRTSVSYSSQEFPVEYLCDNDGDSGNLPWNISQSSDIFVSPTKGSDHYTENELQGSEHNISIGKDERRRRRVKKKTTIRLRNVHMDDEDCEDNTVQHPEVRTFSRTTFKLGRESSGDDVGTVPNNEKRNSATEFTDAEGVWSPGRSGEGLDISKLDNPDLPSFKDQPQVWNPSRAGSASPSLGGRKQFAKIAFSGTSTLDRSASKENITAPPIKESFAWKSKENLNSPSSGLPKVQNPTVTLLQKKREGSIPNQTRPEYLRDESPQYKPDEKLYTIKREYERENIDGDSRKFAVLGPNKVEGVGTLTNDGVPCTLKSAVKSEHQGEWYRRMFDSLHKVKDARYGGYQSEPEGYDSDVGSSRYSTLDRRGHRGGAAPVYSDYDPMTTSLPRNVKRYVHQPGRIENYIPGQSSLSEKEHKANPNAELQVESKFQEPPGHSSNHRPVQKMSMHHALKESGYESDSTLVFRKREESRRLAPDPRKSSQLYRQIQRGGEIPVAGLQKQAPLHHREAPYKYEQSEVNIHYRTPVRIEQKEIISEEELARRQEEHMKKVYEQERRKKYLSELEDIERRRHTDNFTPLQKSPIPLNRYDDDQGFRSSRTPEPKQVCKALFNFTAQNKRELSFNKGDVIFIRRHIDKNWIEGEFRGSMGIFPSNYVEVVDNVKTIQRKSTEGQGRSKFNFQAQTSMEMSLNKGELVVLTRRVDDNWYEGRIGGRKGIFPVSYVDVLVEPGTDTPMSTPVSPMPRPALPAANLLHNGATNYASPYSTLGRPGSQNESQPYNKSLTINTQQEPIPYRALYNYKPQNDDELELLEGDIVLVMEKCDDGWFVGTSRRTGLFGTFPGNYVERS